LSAVAHIDRGTDLSAQVVKGGDQWRAGAYQITAVPATHGEDTLEALLYVIDDRARRLFYATDTSSLSEVAWELLASLGPMDLIMLDETAGLGDGGSGHHGLGKFLDTRARMLKSGVMGSDTMLVAHHFSHNGGLTHAELVDRLRPYGISVSYDGLTLDLDGEAIQEA
jgi:phosphoribosyl 1,2-cyclic phosphate phosphodiesterase